MLDRDGTESINGNLYSTSTLQGGLKYYILLMQIACAKRNKVVSEQHSPLGQCGPNHTKQGQRILDQCSGIGLVSRCDKLK